MPDSFGDADTVNTFKSRLDKHWLDQDVVYNFHSELTGTRGASICICVVKDADKEEYLHPFVRIAWDLINFKAVVPLY